MSDLKLFDALVDDARFCACGTWTQWKNVGKFGGKREMLRRGCEAAIWLWRVCGFDEDAGRVIAENLNDDVRRALETIVGQAWWERNATDVIRAVLDWDWDVREASRVTGVTTRRSVGGTDSLARRRTRRAIAQRR